MRFRKNAPSDDRLAGGSSCAKDTRPLRQNPLLSIHHRVEASRASIQDPLEIILAEIGGCRFPSSGGDRDRGCRLDGK